MAGASDADFEKRAFPRNVTLAQSARATFCDAIMRCMATDQPDRATADALRQSARLAREQHVRPEHVVALIRTVWYQAHPPLRPTVDHDPRLIHLIGTALDAYFADVEAEAPEVPPLPSPRGD